MNPNDEEFFAAQLEGKLADLRSRVTPNVFARVQEMFNPKEFPCMGQLSAIDQILNLIAFFATTFNEKEFVQAACALKIIVIEEMVSRENQSQNE